MSINTNTTFTQGMRSLQNKGTDLFKEAKKLAQDGELSAEDLGKLEKIALKDDKITGSEKVFLKNLQDQSQAQKFAEKAQSSPNKF